MRGINCISPLLFRNAFCINFPWLIPHSFPLTMLFRRAAIVIGVDMSFL